jgi:hypothetical protein
VSQCPFIVLSFENEREVYETRGQNRYINVAILIDFCKCYKVLLFVTDGVREMLSTISVKHLCLNICCLLFKSESCVSLRCVEVRVGYFYIKPWMCQQCCFRA